MPDNGFSIIENVLDAKTIENCKQKVLQLDNQFIKKESDNIFHNKFGTFSEFRDPGELNKAYKKEVKKYNFILWDNFENAYISIAEKIKEHTGIECVYDDRLFFPGIRSFVPKKLGPFNSGIMGFHYDFNIYAVDWQWLLGIKVKNTITATVMIEVPDYSYFDIIEGTETNDPNVFGKNPSKEQVEFIIDRKKSILCEEGNAHFQWNHILHRMGEMNFSSLNQRRTTFQVCGVYDGDKIWLTI